MTSRLSIFLLSTFALFGLVRSQAEKVHGATASLSMPPPDAAAPSAGQRAQLTEWLSCGAP